MESHNKIIDKTKAVSIKLAKIIWKFFKKYYFVIFCIIALLLPDRVLVNLPKDKMFKDSEPAFVSSMFTWWWVLAITLFCVCIPNKKWGKITFGVVSILFICLAFGQYVYYQIFEQFFRIKSIFLLGEGANYLGDVIKLIDAKIIISTIIPLGFVVAPLLTWNTSTG